MRENFTYGLMRGRWKRATGLLDRDTRPKGEKRLGVAGPQAVPRHCSTLQKRNVTDALPERMRSQVNSAMSQAYASGDVNRTRQLLENLARSLERSHPGAAASLRAGLDETLTVMRLELPESLERVLSSTNLIENLFSRVREMARRVRHWQGGAMILRWCAAGVLEAEHNFRKVTGYRSLAKLDAALRAHYAVLDRGVDNRKQAA
jgi:putative transposase